MESRVSVLGSLLPEYADYALIISGENRRDFTNFVSSSGYLLVTRKEAYLLVDFRYAEAAKKQAKGCKVVVFKKLEVTLKEITAQHLLRDIMLEASACTLSEAERIDGIIRAAGGNTIKTAELDRIIGRMRIIKTADEVDKMRQAQRITEEALSDTVKLIKEGVTEKELALELEFNMRKNGADGVAFDLIVLTGKNTSMPHGVPGYEKVKAGDFILFDIGATVDGYHSDMTRTYVLGRADKQQLRLYNTVLEAHMAALEAVRSGVTCGYIDDKARSYIDQAGFEGCFGHSTGHGVGLEIHEAPTVSPKNDFTLQNGMVITIEPGIYIPDKYGVRIEDMVVVSNSGCINLATLPKELIVL